MLTSHADWLQRRAPEVRYSARILYQELRRERGYTGSYETVKRFVAPLRELGRCDSLTQTRFETAPGEQSQVDWGQARVAFRHGSTRPHLLPTHRQPSFLTEAKVSRLVARDWLVSFRSNRYSVPCGLVGQPVEVQAREGVVCIGNTLMYSVVSI